MAFNLPVPEGEPGASLTAEGLAIQGGKVIDYREIKEVICTDSEVTFVLKDPEAEDLVYEVEEGCSHQLLDMEVFIHTHMMQRKIAVMDESREKVINGPVFNVKKIKKSFTKAYAFGA